jgi:hypothetical protein
MALPRHRRIGESPIVPSTPSDAGDDPNEQIEQAHVENSGAEAEASAPERVASAMPVLRDATDDESDARNYAALQHYDAQTDRFNAQRMWSKRQEREKAQAAAEKETRRQANIAREAEFRTKGVQFYSDAAGDLQPVRDEEDQPVYRAKKTVDYASGRAVQTERDTTGAITQRDLDAGAEIGTHPDRPHELYRKNTHTGWDYVGTASEGLKSADPAVKAAALKAQQGLEKDFADTAGKTLALRAGEAIEKKRAAALAAQAHRQQLVEVDTQIETLQAGRVQGNRRIAQFNAATHADLRVQQ